MTEEAAESRRPATTGSAGPPSREADDRAPEESPAAAPPPRDDEATDSVPAPPEPTPRAEQPPLAGPPPQDLPPPAPPPFQPPPRDDVPPAGPPPFQPHPPPPPPGPQQPYAGSAFPLRHGLVRPLQGRYLAGVCAAIGRATNTDPVLWRVLLAVLGFFGGIGILVYLAIWLVTPAEGDSASPVEGLLGRGRSRTSPVLVIILGMLVALMFGFIVTDGFRAALLGAAVLIGGALLLNRNTGDRQPNFSPATAAGPVAGGPVPWGGSSGAAAGPPPPASATPATGPLPPYPSPPAEPSPGPPEPDTASLPMRYAAAPSGSPAPPSPPSPPGPPVPVWPHGSAQDAPPPPLPPRPLLGPPRGPYGPPPHSGYRPPFAPHGPYGGGPPPPHPPGAAPQPPKPPRERSGLGAGTFSLIFVALGVVAVLDLSNAFDPGPSAYFAAALGTVGLGLLVGAWLGRARWLIALGLALCAALGIATAAETADRIGNVGTDVTWAPQTVDEMATRYENNFGNAVLDLSNVNFVGQNVQVQVEVTFGELEVILPPNVDVTASVDVNAGDARVFDDSWGGVNRPPGDVTNLGADGRGGGQLRLDVHVSAGNVEVHR